MTMAKATLNLVCSCAIEDTQILGAGLMARATLPGTTQSRTIPSTVTQPTATQPYKLPSPPHKGHHRSGSLLVQD